MAFSSIATKQNIHRYHACTCMYSMPLEGQTYNRKYTIAFKAVNTSLQLKVKVTSYRDASIQN
jgi:hypothetical protein